ncbi:peroxidase family protein [Calycomorphotria hydatis]|nr:peroxidase family protein [Calycomorphotria hydatis]
MLSAVTPAIDGTGNNVDNPDWGSVDVELLRYTTAEYGDGVYTPAGEDRPSAREVSNTIAAQTDSVVNDRGLTDYIWIWGQFIDHDIDLTEGAEPHEEFNIEVPQGDPYFDPYNTGTVEIGLNRSIYVDGSESSDGQRQQINQITAFLDGSVVYGSDDARAAELRTFEDGKLKTSDGDLLPFNVNGFANAGGDSASLFLAGDVRANENAALTSMHTIWVREHNRIAEEIKSENPQLSDEEIYQAARAKVTAELQAITYNEFLPALLGEHAISRYRGYDSTVNPGIANVFSTAAYRLGHSLLSPTLQRVDADGNTIDDGNLELRNAFFNPNAIIGEGIDSLLRGAATQEAQELDNMIIDDVRNFLFGPPGSGGFDLASLNIQRGRDHGLADYNQARIDYGLAPVTSFDQISSDPDVVAKLEQLYDSVDEIDVWVGGLAEDHVPGSSVGELFHTIIVDQFERLRDGDRFWYQNIYNGHELKEIEQTTLADVIERNTDITALQDNVFFSEDAQPDDHGPPHKEHPGRGHGKDHHRSLGQQALLAAAFHSPGEQRGPARGNNGPQQSPPQQEEKENHRENRRGQSSQQQSPQLDLEREERNDHQQRSNHDQQSREFGRGVKSRR